MAWECAGIRQRVLGSVIYLPVGKAHVTKWSPLPVHDGQRLLATVNPVPEALGR